MVFSLATRNRFLVRDDQQGVHHLLQLDDPRFSKPHAALTFKVERLGDHTDGKDAEFARSLRDDRCRASSGAAAHTGGNEHHVRAGQVIADLVDHLLRRGAPHLGLRAGTEAFGDLGAHLNDALGFGHRERLRVRIGDDEVDAL